MCSLLVLSWAEAVKLFKRRVTWVLLALLVAIQGLRVDNIRGHVFDEPPAELSPVTIVPEDYRQAAVLPGVLERARLAYDWLNLFLILLAALSVGQEFTWGTMRTALARGPGRARLLIAKFVALAVAAAFYLLILWVACGVFGLFTTRSLEGRVDWGFLDGPFFVREMAALGRTWVIAGSVIALALLVAVWVRNPGLSLNVMALAYGFDLLAITSFGGLLGIYLAYVVEAGKDPSQIGTGVWGRLATLLPHYNTAVVIHWARPGKLSELEGALLFAAETLGLPLDPWRGMALLVGYGVVALCLALWVFRCKDVTL